MFEPLPHWCVPLVESYLCKSDIHYFNDPVQCKVEHLTLPQLEHVITIRPRCKDVVKRIVALDAAHLLLDEDIDVLDEFDYRLHDMPFKTNIMDYLYDKLTVSYDPLIYVAIFDCKIRSLACYNWYKKHNWISPQYNLLQGALIFDCVDLLLLCDVLSSYNTQTIKMVADMAISNRAIQCLSWMRENRPRFTNKIFYKLFSIASLDYCLSFDVPDEVDFDWEFLDGEKILWLIDNHKITKQQALDSEVNGSARFALCVRYGLDLPQTFDPRKLTVKELQLAPYLCPQMHLTCRLCDDEAFLFAFENGGILHCPVIFHPNYSAKDADRARLLQLCNWDWNIQWEETYAMPEDVMTVSYFIQHTTDYEEAVKLACKHDLKVEFMYLLDFKECHAHAFHNIVRFGRDTFLQMFLQRVGMKWLILKELKSGFHAVQARMIKSYVKEFPMNFDSDVIQKIHKHPYNIPLMFEVFPEEMCKYFAKEYPMLAEMYTRYKERESHNKKNGLGKKNPPKE